MLSKSDALNNMGIRLNQKNLHEEALQLIKAV